MAKESNNNHGATKYLGVSAPLDESSPKDEDLLFTKKLEECLRSFNLFESEEEMIHRVNVLSQLNDVAQRWIQEKSKSKNSAGDVLQVTGKLFTFGSFRLGVHTKGADIDTLLVAPRNIAREDFFRSFPQELSQMPLVEYVRCIEDAFVPVIKTKIGGIELDILFARLALKTIPDDLDLKSNELLRNLDPKCVRSLNGSRVTDDILSLVPNKEEFKLSLRAIKLWAKQRGIYSNVLGYLGGVSWAMLVARTCQLLPNATASTIVQKFFSIFIEWPWPKPVLLRELKNSMSLDIPIWDPVKNPSDRYHLMPIITPSYPQQNSTFNVTASTRRIMMNEFKHAKAISDEIIENKREWKELFEPFHFFSNHKCFIVLIVASIAEWTGFVESKIRHLVQILEHHKYINYAHVNPKAYTRVLNLDDSSGEKGIEEEQTMWFIGLNFDKSFPMNIDLTEEIKHFITLVRQAAAQRFKEHYKIDVKSVTRKGLTTYLPKREITNPKVRSSTSGTPQDETSQSNSLVDETSIKRKIDSDEEDPKRWRLGESEADPC